MSPLVSAPNRGYADYQRIENYDSGVVWSIGVANRATNLVSPVIDVSRFGYLGGMLQCTASAVTVDILWYADVAGTVLLSQRQLVLGHQVANAANLRIANLGPFVQMTIVYLGGPGFSVSGEIIATNRIHPLELIPQGAGLISVVNDAIPGNGAKDYFPTDYYSGPCIVELVSSVASAWVTLSYYDAAAAPHQHDLIAVTSPGTWVRAQSVLPSGLWVAEAVNGTAGAATMSLSVIGSPTGA